MHILFVVCVLLASLFSNKHQCIAEQVSPFTCAAYSGSAWPVDSSDNHHAQKAFQNWLSARQNDPRLCGHRDKVYTNINGFGTGIGSTYDQAIKLFFKYLELGIIYRPMDTWLWATGFNNTFGTHSIDCFSRPLSYCKLIPIEDLTKYYNSDEADKFSKTALDICSMAKHSKKPTVWAYGQVLHYMLRPGPLVAQYVSNRLKLVFASAHHTSQISDHLNSTVDVGTHDEGFHANNSTTEKNIGGIVNTVTEIEPLAVTIGVHMRGGKPWDGRRILQLHELMEIVDARVADIEKTNESDQKDSHGSKRDSIPIRRLRVSQVFICSDTQASNVKSAEYMSASFPRNFSYVILPHLNYSVGTEAETAVRHSLDDGKNISLLDIYSEYLADVEILVKSDVFIGMYSNVYIMVAALRAARHPERPPSYTSYIDQHVYPYKLTFEGSGRTSIWVDNYKETAFDGPSPFWME